VVRSLVFPARNAQRCRREKSDGSASGEGGGGGRAGTIGEIIGGRFRHRYGRSERLLQSRVVPDHVFA